MNVIEEAFKHKTQIKYMRNDKVMNNNNNGTNEYNANEIIN